MLSSNSKAAYMHNLKHTFSDLVVGLESGDTPEVILQSSILKYRAARLEGTQLKETAHRIEQSAVSGDLDTVRMLISELDQNLRHTLSVSV